MQSGPGVAIGGEIMWDATKVGKAGMHVTVSMTENISGQLIEQEMKERLEMLKTANIANDGFFNAEETQKLLSENLKLKLQNEALVS